MRFKLLEELPLDYEAASLNPHRKYFTAKQQHGNNVEVVLDEEKELFCDGLVMTKSASPIAVYHADCQPAILIDPYAKVLATVHSGWRGSVANVYKSALKKMLSCGATVEEIRVCIGPSLGPESAEFIHFEQELPQEFWKYQCKPTYFDFWEISTQQLLDEGVRREHIEIARIDTFSYENPYPSARRDRQCRRMITGALML